MYCKQDCYTLILLEDNEGVTALELMNENWEYDSMWYRDDKLKPGENYTNMQKFLDTIFTKQLPPIYLSQSKNSYVTVLPLITKAGMTLDGNNFIHSYPEPVEEPSNEEFTPLFEEDPIPLPCECGRQLEGNLDGNIDIDLVDKLLSDGYTVRVEDNKIIIEGKN